MTPLLAIFTLSLLFGSIYCARNCQKRKPISMDGICLSANEMFAQQLHQQHLLQSNVNSLSNNSPTVITPLRMTLPFSYARQTTNNQPNSISTASSKQSNQSLLSNVLNSVTNPGRALGNVIGQSMKTNNNLNNNKLIDSNTQNNLELKALLSNQNNGSSATGSSHYALSSMFPVNITSNPISNNLVHYPLHCIRILTRIYPRLSNNNQFFESSNSGSGNNEEAPSTHLKSSLNYQFYAGQLTVSNQAPTQSVIIRALKLTTDSQNVNLFAEQAVQLSAFSHENIIKMVGVAIGANNHSTIPQHFVIFEQFSPVNLLHFLQQQPLPNHQTNNSSNFNTNAQNTINSNGGYFIENIDLLQIAYQIANGMHYLFEHGYVHGDLACRNCYINNSSPSSGDHSRFQVKIGGLHLQNCQQNNRWQMVNNKNDSGKQKTFKNGKELINQELKEELIEEQIDDLDYYTLDTLRKAFPVR